MVTIRSLVAVAALATALAGQASVAHAGHVCDGESCEVNPTCDRSECLDEDRAWLADVYGYVAFTGCYNTFGSVQCTGPAEDIVWDIHGAVRGG
jgi:hypothetical protein